MLVVSQQQLNLKNEMYTMILLRKRPVGRSDSSVSRAFALHATNLGLIPGIAYVPQNLPGLI